MTYAFSFDARYCSGCKACQAACKDKNNLPTGVLWRRVYEVTGGSWRQQGAAWTNDVFAYNLSISCNHCAYPKCAGVCPTDAYTHREDGIVFLDPTKCIGCGYCAWACPYGAPQYNAAAGHMTKCDLCLDQLEQGKHPACVAACPLRVLDCVDMEGSIRGVALWNTPSALHPYPMPAYSHTQPHLAIMPHPAMNRTEPKSVVNHEEVRPKAASNWDELPLLIFTLLTQLAVGAFLAMNWVFITFWSPTEHDATWLRLLPNLAIGVSLGAGMFASFAHLGTKKNTWRVFAHLRKSSLSREILFSVLFGVSWLITAFQNIVLHHDAIEWTAITSILGIGLIHNMSQVYRFPAAPSWNSWKTNAGFFVSALLLGMSSVMSILAYESRTTGIGVQTAQWVAMNAWILILFMAQLLLIRGQVSPRSLQQFRLGLIMIGITACLLSFFVLKTPTVWTSASLFLIVLAEEGIGRWIFYASRLGETRSP